VSQTFNHVLIHRAALQCDAYIGAGGVAQTLGVDIESATHDDTILYQVLDTLVDGGTRHVALGGYILKRDSGVLGENAQNLLVKKINFIHLLSLLVTICQQK
jgi:hypothetical protein